MLRWAGAWLDPLTVAGSEGSDSPWLSADQRDAAWTAHMPMPLSARMREWNDSHFYAYGHGWRLTDVDGTAKVSHTGTLSGMYSAVTLLPQLHSGFVILINGEAGEARTVLEQVLTKHITAPKEAKTVAYYADALARERQERLAMTSGTATPGLAMCPFVPLPTASVSQRPSRHVYPVPSWMRAVAGWWISTRWKLTRMPGSTSGHGWTVGRRTSRWRRSIRMPISVMTTKTSTSSV